MESYSGGIPLEIGRALYLLLLGMTVVFIVLAFLILISVVLARLFPEAATAKEAAPSLTPPDDEEAAVAAAVGVALAEAEGGKPPPPQRPRPWRLAGRQSLMAFRERWRGRP